MATVYLETSFISACVTNGRDPGSTYRKNISLAWWKSQRQYHDLYVSAEVQRELDSPTYPRHLAALKWIQNIPMLPIDDAVRNFAALLIEKKAMPGPLGGDSIHVALSVMRGVEFILSWNIRHLANPNKMVHLSVICSRIGWQVPQIITPQSL